MKEKKEWYIVQIYSGSYDDYTQEWWLVHHSILPIEWLGILPIEDQVKEYFEKAKQICKSKIQEFNEKIDLALTKHGRRDLLGKGLYLLLARRDLSPELRNELKRIEIPSAQWEDYVEEVSDGKIKKLRPDFSFEYPIW